MTRTAAILAVLALLILPGVAVAATPADVQYGNPVDGEVIPPTAGAVDAPAALTPVAEPATVGILPFTGAELGMILGAGLLILTAGLTLRRIGRKTRRAASASR